MFGAMLDPQFAPTAAIFGRPVGEYARGGMVLAIGLFAALYALVFFPTPMLRLARGMARLVSARLAERVGGWLESFVHGLSVLRSPGRFLAVVGWTTLHWFVNALSFWIAMKAVGIDAPFSATLFLQGLIAIGVAIPQAPGYWGGFEALAAAGLAIYGVREEVALAWGFAYHFVTFIPITLMGAIYFARLGMHMADLKAAAPGPESAPPDARQGAA
jgi:glycosyltransferase 2 family protein